MSNKPLQLSPLGELPLGSPALLAEIRGGRQLTRRLLSLGLRAGTRVTVLHHRGRGVVLSNGETRVALGGGIVDKLWVEPLTEGAEGSTPQGRDTPPPGESEPTDNEGFLEQGPPDDTR
jgi:ferrous iron transport protein A